MIACAVISILGKVVVNAMTPFTSILVFGLMAIALIVMFLRYLGRGREMATLRHQLNMEFNPSDNDSIERCLRATKLGASASEFEIENSMTGEVDGTRIVVFDYRPIKKAFNNEKSYGFRQTITMLLPVRHNFPVFQMRPEGITQKIFNLLGFQDVNFSQHQNFSASYSLHAENEPLIRKFFDAPILDLLSHHPGWSIEGNRRGLIIYKKSMLMKKGQIWESMDLALKLFKLFDAQGQRWLANDLSEVKGLSCMTWLPDAASMMAAASSSRSSG